MVITKELKTVTSSKQEDDNFKIPDGYAKFHGETNSSPSLTPTNYSTTTLSCIYIDISQVV